MFELTYLEQSNTLAIKISIIQLSQGIFHIRTMGKFNHTTNRIIIHAWIKWWCCIMIEEWTYPSPGRLRMISANVTSPALRIKSLRSYWYGQTRHKKESRGPWRREDWFRETIRCCPSFAPQERKREKREKGSRKSIHSEGWIKGPRATTPIDQMGRGNNKRGSRDMGSHCHPHFHHPSSFLWAYCNDSYLPAGATWNIFNKETIRTTRKNSASYQWLLLLCGCYATIPIITTTTLFTATTGTTSDFHNDSKR